MKKSLTADQAANSLDHVNISPPQEGDLWEIWGDLFIFLRTTEIQEDVFLSVRSLKEIKFAPFSGRNHNKHCKLLSSL
mgnify:CR=1 FL=1